MKQPVIRKRRKFHPLEVAYAEKNWGLLGDLLWKTFVLEPEDSLVRMLGNFILEALTPEELQMVDG